MNNKYGLNVERFNLVRSSLRLHIDMCARQLEHPMDVFFVLFIFVLLNQKKSGHRHSICLSPLASATHPQYRCHEAVTDSEYEFFFSRLHQHALLIRCVINRMEKDVRRVLPNTTQIIHMLFAAVE